MTGPPRSSSAPASFLTGASHSPERSGARTARLSECIEDMDGTDKAGAIQVRAVVGNGTPSLAPAVFQACVAADTMEPRFTNGRHHQNRHRRIQVRLATVATPTGNRVVAVQGGKFVDLTAADPDLPRGLRELLEFDAGLKRARWALDRGF